MLLSIVGAALGTAVVAVWLVIAAGRRERADREARELVAGRVAGQLATVRTWPTIELTGLGGARAKLATTCQGYTSYSQGTFRYQLTIDNGGVIDRKVKAAYFPSAAFHIELYDDGGFKQRQVDVVWQQLARVLADSAQGLSFEANDSSGFCGPEIRDYRTWNLSYALPEPRASY